jgi:prevent-host-death family protein
MSKSDVREMGVSDARANMTEVIAEVRLLGKPVVLTRRDKAQAVLVSVDWFEQARQHKRVAEAAVRLLAEAPSPDEAMQRLEELIQGLTH